MAVHARGMGRAGGETGRVTLAEKTEEGLQRTGESRKPRDVDSKAAAHVVSSPGRGRLLTLL